MESISPNIDGTEPKKIIHCNLVMIDSGDYDKFGCYMASYLIGIKEMDPSNITVRHFITPGCLFASIVNLLSDSCEQNMNCALLEPKEINNRLYRYPYPYSYRILVDGIEKKIIFSAHGKKNQETFIDENGKEQTKWVSEDFTGSVEDFVTKYQTDKSTLYVFPFSSDMKLTEDRSKDKMELLRILKKSVKTGISNAKKRKGNLSGQERRRILKILDALAYC